MALLTDCKTKLEHEIYELTGRIEQLTIQKDVFNSELESTKRELATCQAGKAAAEVCIEPSALPGKEGRTRKSELQDAPSSLPDISYWPVVKVREGWMAPKPLLSCCVLQALGRSLQARLPEIDSLEARLAAHSKELLELQSELASARQQARSSVQQLNSALAAAQDEAVRGPKLTAA